MIHAYRVNGMSCEGCRTKVQKALETVDVFKNIKVKLPDTVIAESDNTPSLTRLQNVLSDVGNYTISATSLMSLGIEQNKAEEILRNNQSTPSCQHGHEGKPQPSFGKGSESKYYCPMFCEGEKLYDQAGACPVCGMNLEKIHSAQTHQVTYTCSDHPEIQQGQSGHCPQCGKELIPTEIGQEEETDGSYKDLLTKFKWSLVFTVPIFIIAMSEMIPGKPLYQWLSQPVWNWIQLTLSLPVVFYTCRMFFERAWTSIKTLNLNMFTLIGIGAGVAWIFSVAGLIVPDIFPAKFKTESGSVFVYFEAATVILTLVLLGQMLEARAHGKTNQAIRELLKLTPSVAILVKAGEEKQVPVTEVKVNDIIRVKPGGKIPVDGKILEGDSDIDESMITGEPIPVQKTMDAKVSAGTINGSGSILITATEVGEDTLLSKVIEMVHDASRSRAPIQKLADTVAKYFVPLVILAAIITFVVWSIWGPQPAYAYALVNAIAVLIIACPCALGLATPMSVMVGVGRGAQSGVLIKNAEALERTNKIDVIIVDKTGTLTEGKPSVEKVISSHPDYSEKDITQLIASVNKPSEHSLATATVNYAQSINLSLLDVQDFKAHSGHGVSGIIGGKKLLLGNAALMKQNSIKLSGKVRQNAEALQVAGKTISYLSVDGESVGFVAIGDKLKASSSKAVQSLQKAGIEVLMMTGDNPVTAKTVAQHLGIEFEAECLPEDKLNKIKLFQSKRKVVAMAGDGINDAPALAQADIGIAMGTGTDVAIESSEITLVKGDLSGIEKAYQLSHKTMRNIKENLFFAFIYNILGIPIAAGVLYPVFGILLSPMIAAAAMSFSSVSVITNSLRLKKVKL
ncbi:heavy metal translocating P-type ATPase [Kangiella sediminilitoris]|uniref:Heavy metal translocating P-type ATPase n=1 Tax=Kangiella sediminilitoris TaxID=1144748 RepID=A0A1B3BBB2_9GAMM|nr:heavy metal translocating P-type ATPase [Kangiella sediminilitoris]AOE50056.1 Heavy metal translocating P-type ATPase [Kangiella sediminilitoris]